MDIFKTILGVAGGIVLGDALTGDSKFEKAENKIREMFIADKITEEEYLRAIKEIRNEQEFQSTL